MKTTLQELWLNYYRELHFKQIKKFKSKISFCIENKNYLVKTAQSPEELLNVLKLRYEVFYKELLHKKNIIEMDFDRFDLLCDHLCIIDKRTEQLIGTYRLNASKFNKKFYSATEFSMQKIINLPGHKLELGRACVHQDYRNGITIMLLWKGVIEYLKLSESDYLFGCSSIKSNNLQEIGLIYNYLKEHHHAPITMNVKPKGKFRKHSGKILKHSIQTIMAEESHPAIDKIPALLHSYLKAGAYICGQPAWDKDFQCVDFLTLLSVEQINHSFKKKYGLCAS